MRALPLKKALHRPSNAVCRVTGIAEKAVLVRRTAFFMEIR